MCISQLLRSLAELDVEPALLNLRFACRAGTVIMTCSVRGLNLSMLPLLASDTIALLPPSVGTTYAADEDCLRLQNRGWNVTLQVGLAASNVIR